jgi:secreted trypsin-like serine protease
MAMAHGLQTLLIMKRISERALLVAVVAIGGCDPSGITLLGDEPDGERTPYVVNGQPHSGHPSAGKLTTGGSLCTATLIGKKTVLTAAHCVSPGATHTFTTDDGVKHLSAKVVRHPSYNSYQITNDVAVIILQTEPAVAPMPINLTPPSSGLEVTIVGFGKTSEYSNDAGVKRMAKNKISSVGSTQFSIAGSSTLGNLCNGDSGGPSYAIVNGVEVDLGVHSTKSGACGSGSTDMRVDAYADWITQTAGGDVVKPGAAPTPTPPDTTPPDTTPPAPGPDTTAPTVTVTAPGNGAQVASSLTVTATASDNVGVVKVELKVDGATVASSSGASVSFPIALKAGAHTLLLIASDAAGNQGQASVAVTVADGSAPAPAPTPPAPTPPAPMPTPPETTPPETTPPAAPAPGLFGATCASSKDCQSGLCANDAALGQSYCTQACSASQACPSGAGCFPTANSTLSVCGPPVGGNGPGLSGEEQLVGSCSLVSAPGFAPAPILFLLAILLLGRRRAR